MVVAWEKPIAIIMHGLKAAAMVVQVSLLRSILHAVVGAGTPRPVAVGSLDIMGLVSVVPGGDDHIGLPICRLHGVLVLCAVVLNRSSKVWIVLGQQGSEEVVVMSILRGVLKLVSGGPPHLFWFLWSSWGRHWCWCRSGL
jgi:hypothetical protein